MNITMGQVTLIEREYIFALIEIALAKSFSQVWTNNESLRVRLMQSDTESGTENETERRRHRLK